ncbi:MAG: methylenetetrahydrofolate reductase [NAD(P)H] [Sandaracinus sp.]|nr:methylenetetrahydrofolate reductase [NAD(P)H] [Sandaracinus sp.]
MKVTEHLAKAQRPPISFEIIPPKRGDHVRDILRLVDELKEHEPPFIDITSHPAEVVYEETPDGIQRHVKRKRPGTLGVCALIQNKYKIDAVPHVLCNGFTQQETEDFLIELRYLGIDNVLAIRGDDKGYRKPLRDGRTQNAYARDLIAQIGSMNEGKYLDEYLDAAPTEFCVGCAGYPEKHFEAPNLETDIRRTLEKVNAGAQYVVTQMFFENRHYFDYVKACREAGITVPIIPGLKVLTRRGHLKAIPRTFHCEIPQTLSDELEGARASDVAEIGIQWTRQQCQELLAGGAPALHFYVMSDASAVSSVIAGLSR